MITIFFPALNTDRTDVFRWCVDRFGKLEILRFDRASFGGLVWCVEVEV